MIEVSWPFFKGFLSSSSVGFVYVDEPNGYYSAYAAYEGLTIKCYIGEENKTEFDTYYKSLGNKKLNTQSPFGAKEIDGKKLFKRVHGIESSVSSGSNDIIYTVPYDWVKINGIEILNGEYGDKVSFYILDSTTGTYTTIANYQLNQFGFNVNVAKDYYQHKSEFDADLYLNMQIKIVYTSVSDKTVGFNFLLNELK